MVYFLLAVLIGVPSWAQKTRRLGVPLENSVLNDSLSYHRSQSNWVRWIQIAGLQSQVLAQQGRSIDALELLKRESSLVDSLRRPELLALHFHHFGTYFFEINDFNNAELYHRLAHETLPKNRQTAQTQTMLLSELAHVYFYLDARLPEPKRRFDSIQNVVLKRYLEFGDSASFVYELANSFDYIYGNFGLDSLLRALELCERFDNRKKDSLSVNYIWETRGSFLSLSGDSAQGRYWVRKALAMAERLHFSQRIADLYDSYSLTYQDSKEWDIALRHTQYARWFQDSLNSFEQAKTSERYKVEMETERHKLLAEQRKARLKGYGFGITLISILGVGAVWTYRQQAITRKREAALAHERVDNLLKTRASDSMESLLKGQEEERKRVGRDLHDRLGGLLAAVKVNFENYLRQSHESVVPSSQYFEKSRQLLGEAMDEVRRVSHDLSSGVLVQFGLVSALKDLSDILKPTASINLEISAFGFSQRLNQDLEIQLYRIVQELVSNTLKYADAKTISIDLTSDGRELTLTYEDDGKGFDPSLASTGIGFKNINTRLEPYSGTFIIDSQKGRGSVFIIQIPHVNL